MRHVKEHLPMPLVYLKSREISHPSAKLKYFSKVSPFVSVSQLLGILLIQYSREAPTGMSHKYNPISGNYFSTAKSNSWVWGTSSARPAISFAGTLPPGSSPNKYFPIPGNNNLSTNNNWLPYGLAAQFSETSQVYAQLKYDSEFGAYQLVLNDWYIGATYPRSQNDVFETFVRES